MNATESKIIESIKKIAEAAQASGKPSRQRLLRGIGDDTAVLKKIDSNILYASDMLMDGVHFQLDKIDPALIGRKALAVNLSDIAAMGGSPVAVTVSLAIPDYLTEEVPVAIMRGLCELASSFNVTVCGGDTNIWSHPLVIDVSIIGEVVGKGPVLRCGAKPGDKIFVTGPLGRSILGHHLTFTPRIVEATYLNAHYDLTAMVDISDGLAKDLCHILEQSGCGAVIDPEKVPRQPNEQGSPCTLEQAFCDGEDFELCFTVSGTTAMKLVEDSKYPGSGLHEIGVITAKPGLHFTDRGPVNWSGYEHGIQRK